MLTRVSGRLRQASVEMQARVLSVRAMEPRDTQKDGSFVSAPLSPRDRLIAAARELFGRYGINAIGVDAIVEAAGTAKTTLYKAFGSKEKLVEAVLELEGERWRAWFLQEVDGPGGTPRNRLDRVFPALGKWFGDAQFYGCLLVNAVGEHDKFDGRLRGLAQDHKAKVEARIGELVAQAGFESPIQLTAQITLLIEGTVATAMLRRDGQAAETGGRALQDLLAYHEPQRRQAARGGGASRMPSKAVRG